LAIRGYDIMSNVIRTEERTCPSCNHKYIRKVYNKNSVDSICPKCRRRSDKSSMSPGRFISPKPPVECAAEGCNNLFYKRGTQKYCYDCYEIIKKEKFKKYMKAYRSKKKAEKQENK